MLPKFMVHGQLVEIELLCSVAEETIRQLKERAADSEQVTLTQVQMGDVQVDEIAVSHEGGVATEALVLEACDRRVDQVHAITKRWLIGYHDYDRAWTVLREIRHMFCAIVPANELQRIAVELDAELNYVPEARRKILRKQLEEQQERLLPLQFSNGSASALAECRKQLFQLSLIAASAKQEHWHKINLLRGRLQVTALLVVLLALLALASLFVPGFVDIQRETMAVVCGVTIFGALGGFISALRQYEPVAGDSSGFYLERMLLGLRPLVGATAGLVLYLGQLAEVIKLVPSASAPAYLFIAFCAGFSEQLFLSHLKKGEKNEPKKKKAPEAS